MSALEDMREAVKKNNKAIYDKGYAQGATDMEKAKQIIIDNLLNLIEKERADTIDKCLSIVEHALKDTPQPRFDWCTLWRKLWKEFEELKEQKK